MYKLIIAILMLTLVLLGCATKGSVHQNQTELQKPNGTLAKTETTLSTVPTPTAVVGIFSEKGTKIDFHDITKESPQYFEMIVGGRLTYGI